MSQQKTIKGIENVNHLINIVAFCALMENGDGIAGKSPEYIAEKLHRYLMNTDTSFVGIGGLDEERTIIVLNWMMRWAKVVPEIEEALKEYNKKYGK